MTDIFDRVNDFVENLLADRRPRRQKFRSPEDVEALRTAAALRAAVPEAEVPRPEFRAALRLRLLQELGRGIAPSSPGVALSRRRLVLAWTASTAAALGLGVGVDRWLLPHPPPSRRGPRPPLVGEEGQWTPVAHVRQVPAGSAYSFRAGALHGHLLNEDGQFHALSAACTCMGCLVAWQPGSGEFVCPCHGATFDRMGVMMQGSSAYPGVQLRPLPPIRVKLKEDGTLVVWTIGLESPEPPAS